MSEIFAGQLAAVANVVLAVFAIITAVLAGLAFLKQSREVSDQAEMLNLQRKQLAEQEKTSADQAKVLKLQAEELQESLSQRKQEAAQRRREQAAHVFLTEKPHSWNNAINGAHHSVVVTVTNTSDEPIYEARLSWHLDGKPHRDLTAEEIGTIMPGDKAVKSGDYPRGTNLDVCGAVLRFRDASGTKWTRRPDGYLGEQP
jgi:hypothetical protein